jgi:hypothetical protein
MPSTVTVPLGTGLLSPLDVFGTGTAATRRGIQVVPGSERVFGPDPGALVTNRLVPYARIPSLAATGNLGHRSAVAIEDIEADPNAAGRVRYTDLPPISARYLFDHILFEPGTGNGRQRARLRFENGTDDSETDNNALAVAARIPGLPARPASDPGLNADLALLQPGNSGHNDGYVLVTYLWQNNYSRNPNTGADFNKPLRTDLSAVATDDRPEPDIVKLDYSTRALINVQLGARVYDVSTSTAQSVTVSDKVKVNNVGR